MADTTGDTGLAEGSATGRLGIVRAVLLYLEVAITDGLMAGALWFTLFAATAAPPCQPYCEEPCEELNGDVTLECGGCPVGYACRPGVSGFIQATTQNTEPTVDATGSESDTQVVRLTDTSRLPPPPDSLIQLDGGGVNQAGMCDDKTEQTFTDAFAKLAALPEELFWEAVARVPPDCGAADDISALRERGYAVVRKAVPLEDLSAIAAQFPVIKGNSEGPARFASDGFTREYLRTNSPRVLQTMDGVLSEWYRAGLLPPSQSLHKLMVGGYQFIRTDPHVSRTHCPEPCLGRWHIDPSPSCPRDPKLSLMVQREPAADWSAHGNIMLAPTHSIQRLLEIATRLNATRSAGCAASSLDEDCITHPWVGSSAFHALKKSLRQATTRAPHPSPVSGCHWRHHLP